MGMMRAFLENAFWPGCWPPQVGPRRGSEKRATAYGRSLAAQLRARRTGAVMDGISGLFHGDYHAPFSTTISACYPECVTRACGGRQCKAGCADGDGAAQ